MSNTAEHLRIEAIDEILNHPWVNLEITFENFLNQKLTVPRGPGLYSIYTDTPKEILRQFGIRNDSMHYNLMSKISASDSIPEIFRINQINNDLYRVYNGHQSNLRQRVNEHFMGTSGTACLALFEIGALRDFQWRFEYLSLTQIENYADSKNFFRTEFKSQNWMAYSV